MRYSPIHSPSWVEKNSLIRFLHTKPSKDRGIYLLEADADLDCR